MKILSKAFEKGYCKLLLEDSEDLFTLSLVINQNDKVKGSAERKIRLGGEGEKGSVVRKKITVTIDVENVEFSEIKNELRINGRIIEAPDFIPKGDFQTISIVPGDSISIEKKWTRYDMKRIEEAVGAKRIPILAVLFDREEALFFLLKGKDVNELTKIKGEVSKKGVTEKVKDSEFYKDIVKQIEEYMKKEKIERVVCASPAFWKDYLEKELSPELKKKAVFSTISHVDKTAVRELITRPELIRLLQDVKAMEELSMIEEVLKALSTGKLAYSIEDVEVAVNEGNSAVVITTDKAISIFKTKGEFSRIESLLKICEKHKGKVVIFSSKEASERINDLGGIVAIKRWTTTTY